MKGADVIEGLRRRHRPGSGWVTVSEVRVGTGWSSEGFRDHPELLGCLEQRIDFFAWNTWPSTGFERVAYEVKVCRSDFLREIADPSKRAAAELLSHAFYFATPAGLVATSEVPTGCGLVEVHESGVVRCASPATRRDGPPVPMPFLSSLLRVASEQRSIDRRCGVNGCGGSVRQHRRRGVLVPLCEPHAEAWDETVRRSEQQWRDRVARAGAA